MDGRDPAWQPDDDYRCHAAIGSRLFLELMNAAGKNAFWNAATGMYEFAAGELAAFRDHIFPALNQPA